MKIERKLYAVVLVSILLAAGILSTIATRTITDTNDTWTGTIVQSGNLDFKSGAYFNLSKKIWNSKGHVYNATVANLQTAIYDLNSTSGGTVWIPAGTITTTVPISITNNTRVIGAGIGKTIIKVGASFTDANSYGVIKVLETWKVNNFTLSDFTVNGDYTATSVVSYWGIIAKTAKDFLIQNIKVMDAYNGINIYEDCERYMVKNIFVDTVAQQHGCTVNGEHAIIDGVIVRNKANSGYCPFGADLGNSTVNNIVTVNSANGCKFGFSENVSFSNIIISNVYGNGGYGVHLLGANNSNFDNIHIYGSPNRTGVQNGLWIGSNAHNTNFNNIEIVDCSNYGISIDGSARRLNFNNVYIDGATARGFVMDSTVSNIQISNMNVRNSGYCYLNGCNNISFTNLYITGSTGNGLSFNSPEHITITNARITGSATAGIAPTDATYCTIVNSIIENNVGYGITLIGCSYFTIENCQILESGTNGIDVSSTCHNITVMGCTFKGNDIDGLETDASNYMTVIGNTGVTATDDFDDNMDASDTVMMYGNLGGATWACFTVPNVAPTVAHIGSMYVNTTTGDVAVYSGSAWIWTHG